MTDFYSIHDAKHNNIKHGQVVSCIDDWDNLFKAKYDARHDSFIQSIESNDDLTENRWDYCELRKAYICNDCYYFGGVDGKTSIYAGNKISKFMPWDKEKTEGVKS
jgi:hypothetical protein